MNFVTFGNKENPAIILIHGVCITEKMMYPLANKFKENYYVILPILDGHDLHEDSTFTTVEDEAKKISQFVLKDYGNKVRLVYGSSLGGTIAIELVKQNNLSIDNAIIDGSPVIPFNRIMTTLLVKPAIFQRKLMMHGLKKGSKYYLKSLKKTFYPKEMIDEIYKISLVIKDETITRVHNSTFSYSLSKFDTCTNLTYWYGEKEAFFGKKYAKHFLSIFPKVRIKIFPSFGHGELVIGNPDLCIKEIVLLLEQYNYNN